MLHHACVCKVTNRHALGCPAGKEAGGSQCTDATNSLRGFWSNLIFAQGVRAIARFLIRARRDSCARVVPCFAPLPGKLPEFPRGATDSRPIADDPTCHASVRQNHCQLVQDKFPIRQKCSLGQNAPGLCFSSHVIQFGIVNIFCPATPPLQLRRAPQLEP